MQSLDNKSIKPCKIPEFWEIQICIDVPMLLYSIWELLSNTLFAYTIGHMYFFQFLPLSSSFFQFLSEELEEIPFFQFLPFFPEETYFFRKFLNPANKTWIKTSECGLYSAVAPIFHINTGSPTLERGLFSFLSTWKHVAEQIIMCS